MFRLHIPAYRMRSSFTLLELIVTVAILSVGIVFIYEGFFTALGASVYCQDYLDVQMWIDQQLWSIQDNVFRYNIVFAQGASGDFTLRGRRFHWDMEYALVEGTERANLYEVMVRVNWRQGQRDISVSRSTYVMHIEDEEA